MRKLFYFIAIVLSILTFSSFTEEGESTTKPKTKCDASNKEPCKIEFADGTTVNATGKLTTVGR